MQGAAKNVLAAVKSDVCVHRPVAALGGASSCEWQQPNQWQQPFADATVAAGDDADVAQLEMMQFLLAGEAPPADRGGLMTLPVRQLLVQASPPSSPATNELKLKGIKRWSGVQRSAGDQIALAPCLWLSGQRYEGRGPRGGGGSCSFCSAVIASILQHMQG